MRANHDVCKKCKYTELKYGELYCTIARYELEYEFMDFEYSTIEKGGRKNEHFHIPDGCPYELEHIISR